MVGRKEDALLAVDCVLWILAQHAVGDTTGDAAGDAAGLVGRLLAWEDLKRVGGSTASGRTSIRPDNDGIIKYEWVGGG